MYTSTLSQGSPWNSKVEFYCQVTEPTASRRQPATTRTVQRLTPKSSNSKLQQKAVISKDCTVLRTGLLSSFFKVHLLSVLRFSFLKRSQERSYSKTVQTRAVQQNCIWRTSASCSNMSVRSFTWSSTGTACDSSHMLEKICIEHRTTRTVQIHPCNVHVFEVCRFAQNASKVGTVVSWSPQRNNSHSQRASPPGSFHRPLPGWKALKFWMDSSMSPTLANLGPCPSDFVIFQQLRPDKPETRVCCHGLAQAVWSFAKSVNWTRRNPNDTVLGVKQWNPALMYRQSLQF